jgi:hypothetical protein
MPTADNKQITLIRMLCTIVAITSILRFYSRAKSALKPKGVMKKLLCFKILVFLNVLQSVRTLPSPSP